MSRAFATPESLNFVNQRRWPLPGLLLAAACGALAAWQGSLVYSDFNSLQDQRAGLASLQRKSQQPPRPAMSPQDVQRHAQLDGLVRYLATPWEPLLTLFEDPKPAGVQLTKFRPDAATGMLELTARVGDPAAMTSYLVALEHDSRLRNVMLRRNELLREGGSGASLEFTIVANWSASGATVAASAPASSAPAASAGAEGVRP
jgi:Tfp pilus assembly protein PilN